VKIQTSSQSSSLRWLRRCVWGSKIWHDQKVNFCLV
jgi:hypothetical protein